MKTIGIWALCLCLAVCLFTGCQQKQVDTPDTTPDDIEIETDKTLLHVDLATLFTTEEIGELLDVEIMDYEVFEAETSISYRTADYMPVAILAVLKCNREIFDEMVASYTDVEETPNLGQVAYWAAAGELLVYESGYAISVHLSLADEKETDVVLLSRQIAALTIERIFA